jgi:hypothetical protein
MEAGDLLSVGDAVGVDEPLPMRGVSAETSPHMTA